MNYISRQDEVKYAVSEKGRSGYGCENVNEDDGLYCDVLGCNWDVLGFTGLYWTVVDYTGL